MDINKDIENCDVKSTNFKKYFISKLINIVSATINEDLSYIKTKDIIAGLKPENTNYLLTKIGEININFNIDIENIRDKLKNNQETSDQSSTNKSENISHKQINRKQSARITKNSNDNNSDKPIIPKISLKKVQQINDKLSENRFTNVFISNTKKLERPRTARRAPPKIQNNVVNNDDSTTNNDSNNVISMDVLKL